MRSEIPEAGQVVNVEGLLRMLENQGYRCALSGEPLTPAGVNVDHIHPVKLGGRHELENLQLLTPEVNQMKGTLTQERFIELCKLVAAKH